MFIVKVASVLIITLSVCCLASPAYAKATLAGSEVFAEKSRGQTGEEVIFKKQRFIDADGDGLNDLIIVRNGNGTQGDRTQQGAGTVINNSGQSIGRAGSGDGLRMNERRR